MPFVKPQVILEVQEQLVELMEEFSTVEDMYKNGDFNSETVKFLERNPVTGKVDPDCQFAKVNGVYVDMESVMEADREELPVKDIQE